MDKKENKFIQDFAKNYPNIFVHLVIFSAFGVAYDYLKLICEVYKEQKEMENVRK